MPDTAAAPRRGRRPGSVDTRRTVLDAARLRFAADGFSGATMRKIAADAGVDPALVVRFFGSKDDLFAAAMSIPDGAIARIDAAFDGPRESLGARVAETWLSLWEDDSEFAAPLLAMYRSAVGNEQAATQLREFIQTRLLEGIAPRLGTDDSAAVRASMASSMLLGIVVGRRVMQIAPLAGASRADLLRLVAPAIQAVLVPGAEERPAGA